EEHELVILSADVDCRGKSAVDAVDKHGRGGDCPADVDDKLNDLDPDNGLDAAIEREDDHHDAEDQDRADNDECGVGLRLKCRVDRSEHDGGKQQSDAVGDVPHYDEKARGKHFDLAAEAFAEELIDGL